MNSLVANTMPPKTVFDLVKSHISLPLNRDYAALKRVLRDWHRYSTQVPLHSKPTFPAELVIAITRTPPSSHSKDNRKKSNRDSTASRFVASTESSASPTARSRRWSLWNRRDAVPTSSGEGAAATAQGGERPLVYRKVVPLHVWTAVLPWEMQRGLSFSDLALPSSLAGGSVTPVAREGHEAQQKTDALKEEEEDLYGVVTPAGVVSGPPACAATRTSAQSPSVHRTLTSITPPVPAMLFLADVPSTKAHGIGFWSGAIRQPIDVLFIAPTLPTSVGPTSPSFQHLREQDGRAAVEDNLVSQQVLKKYFPLHEMHPPSAPAASSSVTFRLHSFSHLDPLPPSLHPSRLGTTEGRTTGLSFTAAPDAPYNSIKEAPRYILETPRHTLQPAVTAALLESRSLLGTKAGAVGNGGQGQDEDQDASIDLIVSLSDALRKDIFAKAQLCVEYVTLLEDAIAHYARELNMDRTAMDGAANPIEDGDASADNAQGDGSPGTNEKPIKVWLSEHESRWMTPEELRRASQATADVNDSKGNHGGDEGACDTDEHLYEAPRQWASEVPNRNESCAEEDVVASPVAANTISTVMPSSSSSSTAMSAAQAAAQAAGATPAQPDAVSAARSISLQSPMLRDETEGRPSYLAPSFVGRHESSTLQRSSVVLSADKLARYPKTHSHMPQLPPVDYELYDLCTRLGVGQQAILYHYHERILREWRAELQRRRSLHSSDRRGIGDVAEGVSASRAIDPADVQRMVALVRDRSLQLAPELVSLVEAVAAA
ncbi:hypothetical protein ABL78_4325 [Leptomonas seymouri]|uniref:Uncharacterized protein n=1 Tax=Leptomonas seymouri TaxID=5684 RepID=A0A0N0P5L1_LEPSE|nr:hypothetical protein ABL78_4325 [Leptomonas seymouri]|eukprot:KPI86596.1 hypothetical protein ABL78_4325 [Leptomonas seymouri]